MAGRTAMVSPLHLRRIAAAVVLGGTLLCCAGCSRKEPPPTLEGLPSDESRLLLPRLLSFDQSFEDVQERIPALSPPKPDAAEGAGAVRSAAPIVVFGRQTEIETIFREGALAAFGYRFTTADGAAAEAFFERVRRTYVLDLGNFHEERRSGTGADTVRCFWSVGSTGLHLEWTTGPRHTVRARFFRLTGQPVPAV